MKKYIQTVRTYITSRNNKELSIGIAIIGTAIALIVTIAAFVFNSIPKVVYQPADACVLFTLQEAKELLGGRAMKTNVGQPVQLGDTTQSRCGYTDGSSEQASMVVAAIMIRSGINDKGVEKNKSEFAASKPSKGIESVTDLGDGAYFNQVNGQLNVLDGRNWIIISYGIGSAPESNVVANAVDLARKVIK